MSSNRPPFNYNSHPGVSPNLNMNPNVNFNRRSWSDTSPMSHGNYSPNRFGSPFVPSIVEQKNMYRNHNNLGSPSPVNYNTKSNCMTPPRSPFHTPRNSNTSHNSSFSNSFNNSPRRAFSPRYPNQHSSPYPRNNRNSMGRKSFDNNRQNGQKPWKVPGKGYFKPSMMEDPWQHCKGSKVQNNGNLETSSGKVKKGRYFS